MQDRRKRVLQTARLRLDQFVHGDASFVVELLNDADFIACIGDKGVRNPDEARRYLDEGPLRSYARHGFGLWRVALRDGDTPIGMCGLLRREGLDDADLGYAYLPAYRGQGYAYEAALAVMAHARSGHGLRRLLAVVSAANGPSIRLLQRLGFRYLHGVTLPGARQPLPLYVSTG